MRKKPIVEVGEKVPRSLKFGIIVAVAIFWADFLRSLLAERLSELFIPYSEAMVDLSIAIIVTTIGLVILATYPKIRNMMKKLKI
ncbi:hypothetical protein GF412_03510 [Candidatus Micrarchaeota archaeon]|nr:hypothetical protein [Candidatus Micrarchaeota archaeon]MBD3418019.1 hypothetical protein [Candidatus Micrarchaeota archaeon]